MDGFLELEWGAKLFNSNAGFIAISFLVKPGIQKVKEQRREVDLCNAIQRWNANTKYKGTAACQVHIGIVYARCPHSKTIAS